MYSREQYMNKECSHDEYYLQFDCERLQEMILLKWSPERLKAEYEADKHFNNLSLGIWDNISKAMAHRIMEVNGKINGRPGWSLSDGVCAAKASARKTIGVTDG